MMAQHMEKLLILMEEAVANDNQQTLKQLAAKSKILRRRDVASASVIRELTNNRVVL